MVNYFNESLLVRIFSYTLLFCFIAFVKYFLTTDFSVGGHDTFQYIRWSEYLYTDERVLIFFRPVLYAVIHSFHLLLGYSQYTFKIMLFVVSMINFLVLLYIASMLKLRYQVSMMLLCSVLLSKFVLVGDSVGFVSSIEVFFLLGTLLFGIKFFESQQTLYYVAFGLFGLFVTLCHEEKFIYWFFLNIYVLRFAFSKIFFSTAVMVITIIILILSAGGQSVDENNLRVAGSIATNWNNPLYVLSNILKTYISAAYEFGFIENALLVAMLIKLAAVVSPANVVSLFKFHRLVDLKETEWRVCDLLLYPSVLYFITVGAIFSGIDLPRTTSVVMIPIIIFLYSKLLNGCKFSLPVILAFLSSLCVNVYSADKYAQNEFAVEGRYNVAFAAIGVDKDHCETGSILILESFDDRSEMWGGGSSYGLMSEVYLGDCAVQYGMLSSSNSDPIDFIQSNSPAAVVTLNDLPDGALGAQYCRVSKKEVVVFFNLKSALSNRCHNVE